MGSLPKVKFEHLLTIITWLNKVTNSPIKRYREGETGARKSNIGHYYLLRNYGGNALHQVCSTTGESKEVFACGYTTNKDLYVRIEAFIDGYQKALNSVIDSIYRQARH